MYRSRYAPGNDSTESDEELARSLHEAELRGVEAHYRSRHTLPYNDALERFSGRGRRIGEPSNLERPGTGSTTLLPELLRRIHGPTDSLAWIWDIVLRLRAEQELQAAVNAVRDYREAQTARDEQVAAFYEMIERKREAQIADDRAIAQALQDDTSFDEDSTGEDIIPQVPFDSNWISGSHRNGTPFDGAFSCDGHSTGSNNLVPRPSRTERRTATRQQPPAPAPNFNCAVCFTSYPASGMAHLPCDHYYCPECISTLVDGAIAASISRLNPQPFPPSCCPGHPIPYRSVINLLSGQITSDLIRHDALLSTPIEERIWCAEADCGRFIPPSNCANTYTNARRINGINRIISNRGANANLVRCPTCALHTCAQCKRLADDHMGGAGGVCPEDDDVKALLATAQQRGWQQCFRCKNMVEKRDGCNHMTCTCGAQFCYVCGARWQGRQCNH